MCGVAGYFGKGVAPAEAKALLARMTSKLSHRGPDDNGIHIDGEAGLAHRRLSIVGLSDGHQPMSDPSDNLVISYNGEIFNYVELRNELIARGRKFRTQSDTEVILHLYAEKGLDCLDDLNGDFAFALWDTQQRCMVLARDRMGVRPLFHTQRGDTLFFASEIKALLTVPGIEASLDPFALDQIFTLWTPLASRTAFQGISELPPGHLMIIKDGRIDQRAWWRQSYPDAGHVRPRPDAVEELRALLDDATRIRLRADVPVGSYLSGGLDSSLVSTLAARAQPERLSTFSLGFDSEEHDESKWQALMATALGVEHTTVRCTAGDISELFPSVIRHVERPILRTAPAPLAKLSALVHQNGIKAVLTGEGADELFAGYDIFREAKLRRFCGRQPDSQWRPLLFQRLYPYLPGLQRQSPEYLARFFGAGDDRIDDLLYSHRPRFRSTSAAKLFFSPELKRELGDYDATAELASMLPPDFSRWHPLHQAQYLETSFLLPGYILSAQGDRVMMANSLEGRFPFLDPRIIDFAAALPPDMKLHGLREKHILKQAAKGLVPDAIIERPKQPYRAPDSQAFAATPPGYLADALSTDAVARGGFFNAAAVEKLKNKVLHQETASFRDDTAFVGIVSTQLWLDTFSTKTE
ncbi:MAG TPA: asparagine synthase (glutamine-hydrolyzing) [Mesorhizobium sp.]|jgi:asparagine synthase (glutamine-hydrolysing)|uniref:asparagine synthase (glutamine-hydrolyzing) n=1 Tax=Mesorhizobium sp. TaxID=1871066 RepID=UPI002DDD12FC|nr:asparagine synthase (glutamine-hydrolyzing) [Mesorhizobium sp.]HEV2502268.1 asparagine synthase (glutamine-hydrolyzing) [Mesorhizobium sp.]